MIAKLVDIPDLRTRNKDCYKQLKRAFDKNRAIELPRSEADRMRMAVYTYLRHHDELPYTVHIKTFNTGKSIIWLEAKS